MWICVDTPRPQGHCLCILTPRGQWGPPTGTASPQSHLLEAATAEVIAAPQPRAPISLQAFQFFCMNLSAAFLACVLFPVWKFCLVFPSGFLRGFGLFLVFRQPLKAFEQQNPLLALLSPYFDSYIVSLAFQRKSLHYPVLMFL